MKQKAEKEMYKFVCEWLVSLLKPRYKTYKVEAYDTSTVALYRWLEKMDFNKYFPEYLAFDIKVDVTGIIYNKRRAHLVFVECKQPAISLKDISQLLGYCRVAKPKYAFIISPNYISEHVSYLLKTYNRYDVLHYSKANRIRVATWNYDRKGIDANTLLPPGEFIV